MTPAIREKMAKRSVLDIALDVHMRTTGSMEDSPENQEADLNLLEEIVASWQDGYTRTWDFDQAVLEVIHIALRDAGRDTNGR